MSLFALRTLFADRGKLLTALAGVVFALVLVQGGLYFGLMRKASVLTNHCDADLWIGHRLVENVDFTQHIPEVWLNRIRGLEGAAAAEPCIVGKGIASLPDGGYEDVWVIGADPATMLGGGCRSSKASGPTCCVLTASASFDARKLGHPHVGDVIEINEQRARAVAMARGVLGFVTTPHRLTNLSAARRCSNVPARCCSYFLVQAADGANVEVLRQAVRERIPEVDVYTAGEFGALAREYFLKRTGIGINFGAATLLGMLVGPLMVAQSLHAVALDHLGDYATLKAMGADDRQVFNVVILQALSIAASGSGVGVATVLEIQQLASSPLAPIEIPPSLLLGGVVLVFCICLASVVLPWLRIRRVDPAVVLQGNSEGQGGVALRPVRGTDFEASAMTELAIHARNLCKAYRAGSVSTPALRELDLDVRAGACVFLVGPSGSGKTTLLSILGCVLSADRGDLWVLGQKVAGWSRRQQARFRRERIGFVFQRFHLFAGLRAWENVRVAFDLLRHSPRHGRTESLQLLGRVGLADRAFHRLDQFSMGQRQRVALGRPPAGNPDLILADEPTASLDSHTGRRATELLKNLCAELGKTVVVVTHDNRIYSLAVRILTLVDGRIADESRVECAPLAGAPRESVGSSCLLTSVPSAASGSRHPGPERTVVHRRPKLDRRSDQGGHLRRWEMKWILLLAVPAVPGTGFVLSRDGALDLGWPRAERAGVDGARRSSDRAHNDDRLAERRQLIFANGLVEGKHGSVELSFEIEGRIESIDVREGRSVKAGQPLAHLNADVWRAKLDAVRVELALATARRQRLANAPSREAREVATAQFKVAEVLAEQTARDFDRGYELRKSGAITQQQWDDIQHRHSVALAEAALARAQPPKSLPPTGTTILRLPTPRSPRPKPPSTRPRRCSTEPSSVPRATT